MYVLNLSVCVNELIMSFLLFIQCFIRYTNSKLDLDGWRLHKIYSLASTNSLMVYKPLMGYLILIFASFCCNLTKGE